VHLLPLSPPSPLLLLPLLQLWLAAVDTSGIVGLFLLAFLQMLVCLFKLPSFPTSHGLALKRDVVFHT
jgi:hypothetical protein